MKPLSLVLAAAITEGTVACARGIIEEIRIVGSEWER